jgi:signal transduction histidine kinase
MVGEPEQPGEDAMNEMGPDWHRIKAATVSIAATIADRPAAHEAKDGEHVDGRAPRVWAHRRAVRAPVLVVLAIGVSWLAVFLTDLLTRTDLALSMCYVVPIALTLWLPPWRGRWPTTVALTAALAGTAVAVWIGADAVHGPGIRPHVGSDPVALGNRLLGAVSQAGVAWAVVRHRRLRERERELIAKLEAALRATDEFIAIASHELKTPLAGARGYAQLLLRRARRGQMAGLDGQSHAALALIDDLLGRLNLLADDLLHVSRLQAGRLDLRLERVDLASLPPRAP